MKNSKKLVNLISLVVLVTTNILSPLSYATAGEEDIGSVSDTVSYWAEQGSGWESPAEASEWSDNNESSWTEWRNLGDAEEDTQDSSATLQNDDKQVEPQNDDSILSWTEWNESEESYVWSEEWDTQDSLIAVQIDKQESDKLILTAFELATARETLNVEPITKSERYNKVTVNVEAPAETFPEGTYASIRPIVSETRLDEIKWQISKEDDTISGDSEIVAFDITFLYKLSDDTEVEVQPKENTVKVTFNYEDNENLSKADENDDQEVKIFHLDDKDENGEVVDRWAEKVVEVTNKEESIEDGIAVADAESFSVYVVTVTVNSNTYDLIYSDTLQHATIQWEDEGMNDFYYGTITIPVENWTDIVMMDRNLGANAKWNTGTYLWGEDYSSTVRYTDNDFYGYYYKWWNNQWFKANSTNFSEASVGGGTWYQWPCPTWWHVPDRAEWLPLKNQLNTNNDWQGFAEALLLPPAGFRYYQNNYITSIGSLGIYWEGGDAWSSSANRVDIKSSGVTFNPIIKTDGLSVRCFMDSPKTVTFKLNNGEYDVKVSVNAGSTIAQGDIPAPTRTDYILAGWYTDDETFQNEFDFDTAITDDVELYAKWNKDCWTSVYFEEMDVCATRDTNNIVYYWTDENDNGVISIKDPDGNTILTMLDKNEWASVAWLWEDSYGELYQRWNNAPIKTAPTSTDRAEYKNYWPWHSFYDATFRSVTNMDYNDYRQPNDTAYYNNLWWWSWDSSNNSRWWINNWDVRQWPCDSWYHVPSIMEWNALITYWYNTKNSSNKNIETLNSFSDSAFFSAFLLPLAGFRNGYTTNFIRNRDDSHGETDSIYGYYRSSSPYNSNKAYILNITRTYRNWRGVALTNMRRVDGYPVRCFKDSSDAANTIILTFDENWWDLLWAEWENGEWTLIQKVESWKQAQEHVSPTKDGATFQGWTTERDGNTVFNFSNPVTTSRTLYAKWKSICPEGEEYVEDKCIPSRAIIRDSESGEIIQINDMEWDDLELYFLKSDGTTGHYTLMDRNMWATEVYNQNQDNPNFESLWYHYQRWNNYGFKPCEWNECSTFPWWETAWNIVIEKSVWEAYAPSKYARNTWSTADNWMWWAGDNDNLRWWAWDEKFSDGPWTGGDRQWPCPDEYHIPSAYEWNQMSNAWEDAVDTGFSFTKGVIFDSDFLMPSAGYRSSSTHAIDLILFAHYWSSSPWSSGEDWMRLYVNGGPWVSNLDRSNWLSIRCMKNTNNADTLQIHANWWTNAVIAFTGSVSNWRFTSLWTPRKGNSVFVWWYDAPVDWNKLETWSAVVPDIYARWVVNVTFNPKGWSGIPSQTINLGEYATQPTDPTRDNSEFKWWYLEDPSTAFDFEHTVITDDITLNAKWKCNSWYIEKWNSCVKSVVVTFDSNWWTAKESVEIEEWTKLKSWAIKYSHTSNISDAGVRAGNYGSSLSTKDVVTIPGAPSLHVNLTYGTENNWDMVYVFEGTYDGSVSRNMSAGQKYKFMWENNDTLTETFDIEWDTVTFAFYSDSNTEYYWYYAIVSWVIDNLWENPTREGYIFTGWYTEPQWGVKFDPETTSITENMTLYAHWESNCPEGQEYAETDEQCYPSRAIIRDSESGEIIQINDQQWSDLELYFLKSDGTTGHYTIMDRNMWATEVYNWHFDTTVNTWSLWYHYQWWNNYWFASCWNWSDCTNLVNWDTYWGVVDKSIWEQYIPSQFARKVWNKNGTTVNWMSWSTTTDWIWWWTGDRRDSWNGEFTTKKWRQWPCPDGYYIPSVSDWKLILNNWKNATRFNTLSDNGVWKELSLNLLLPPASNRVSNDMKVAGVGSAWIYWTSSPNYAHWWQAEAIKIQESYVPNTQVFRSQGLTIRCVKNYPTTSAFRLYANGWKNAVVAFTGTVGDGKFTTLWTPTRSNSTFSGWYDAEVWWNKLETWSTVVSDIYARWNCDNGYVDNGTACVAWVTVSFLSWDHGTLSWTTEYVIFSESKLSDIEWFSIPTPVDNAKYVFSGWNPAVNINASITSDKTYIATWRPINDKNNNWIADEDEEHFTLEFTWWTNWTLSGQRIWLDVLTWLTIDEAGIIIPEVIPNSGYMFSGWNPEITGWTVITSWMTLTPIYGEDNNWDGQNDEFEIKYTVIYKDWVDWVEIFADQKTENILSWTATPAFVWTPTRENYVFSWWTPAVAEKVTSNATYSAQWKVDTNNNWVADEDETYALTINYVYSKWGTAADSHVGYVLKWAEYSVTSPSVTNYETIDTVVSWTMPWEAKTVTVTYTPIHDTNNNNIADEEEIKYTLTIQYHDKKWNTVYDDYTGQYVAWAHYERESQPKEYYTITSWAIVSWTMPADNLTLTVVYEANLDANDNGIADQDETKYTLTIHYVNAKWWKLYDDYTGEYVAWAPYNVVSDTSDTNYTIESWKETVSWTMPAQNQTLTVVYTAKTDANGNGIADEDETSDFHTLTIHYVNSKWATLFSDHVESIVKWATYTVNSPSKDHYTIDRPIVSWTMGDEDVTETVVYNTETADTNDNWIADEDETPHVLTIMYRYSRDEQAHEPVIASYLSWISYSVTSPIIANYTADKLVVEWIMWEENKIVIVTYSPDEDENHDGYADALETKYTVTVHYEYSRGWVAHADNVEQDVLSGLSYSITSPTIAHYTASKQIISWIVTGVNIEETVVYIPVNDANGDGYADEDETKYTVIYTDWVDNEVIFADQKTENILSWTATPAFVWTPTRENYIFSWWTPNVAPKVTKNATYTARWKEDFNHNGIDDATELHYTLTIHYVNGSGWKVYDDYIWSYVSWVNYTVTSPLRTYYTIQTWWEVISGVMWTWNIEKTVVYIANHDTNGNWIADEEEVVPTPSGWWSSGGWWKKMPTTDTHGSAIDKDTQDSTNKDTEDVKDSLEDKKWEEKTDLNTDNIDNDSKWGVTDNGAWQSSDSSSQWQGSSSSSSVSYTQEQVEAYTFAKANGITTKSSIEEAKMNTTLTRIQMAKMLSNFAINVLWEAPDTSKSINFKDVSSKKDKEYDNWVTLAYQLWIMWQNMKNNEFRPNDEVTRGEFASALSRLLYNTPEWEYKSTWKYYVPHIAKLYNEWIINKVEPKLKEKRWYVMLMLMRSVK